MLSVYIYACGDWGVELIPQTLKNEDGDIGCMNRQKLAGFFGFPGSLSPVSSPAELHFFLAERPVDLGIGASRGNFFFAMVFS
jgi:hypothetical protein